MIVIAKRKYGRDYFGLDRVLSIILVIIPITAWILGILTKANQGKWISVIIRIVFGWNIIWILDILFMVFKKEIFPIL